MSNDFDVLIKRAENQLHPLRYQIKQRRLPETEESRLLVELRQKGLSIPRSTGKSREFLYQILTRIREVFLQFLPSEQQILSEQDTFDKMCVRILKKILDEAKESPFLTELSNDRANLPSHDRSG